MSFTTIPSHAPVRLYRSKLFVPGSRPALFEKAAASAADVVCLDLEDAVAPSDKDTARDNIVAALNDVNWGTKASPIPDMNFRRGLRKRWMGGSIPKNAPGSTNV